jgi:hypothetical protein
MAGHALMAPELWGVEDVGPRTQRLRARTSPAWLCLAFNRPTRFTTIGEQSSGIHEPSVTGRATEIANEAIRFSDEGVAICLAGVGW